MLAELRAQLGDARHQFVGLQRVAAILFLQPVDFFLGAIGVDHVRQRILDASRERHGFGKVGQFQLQVEYLVLVVGILQAQGTASTDHGDVPMVTKQEPSLGAGYEFDRQFQRQLERILGHRKAVVAGNALCRKRQGYALCQQLQVAALRDQIDVVLRYRIDDAAAAGREGQGMQAGAARNGELGVLAIFVLQKTCPREVALQGVDHLRNQCAAAHRQDMVDVPRFQSGAIQGIGNRREDRVLQAVLGTARKQMLGTEERVEHGVELLGADRRRRKRQRALAAAHRNLPWIAGDNLCAWRGRQLAELLQAPDFVADLRLQGFGNGDQRRCQHPSLVLEGQFELGQAVFPA